MAMFRHIGVRVTRIRAVWVGGILVLAGVGLGLYLSPYYRAPVSVEMVDDRGGQSMRLMVNSDGSGQVTYVHSDLRVKKTVRESEPTMSRLYRAVSTPPAASMSACSDQPVVALRYKFHEWPHLECQPATELSLAAMELLRLGEPLRGATPSLRGREALWRSITPWNLRAGGS